jgi:hypothetical protein
LHSQQKIVSEFAQTIDSRIGTLRDVVTTSLGAAFELPCLDLCTKGAHDVTLAENSPMMIDNIIALRMDGESLEHPCKSS